MDGKHARRTNTSSPLGELFDHGCDALSTLFVVLGICIALNLGEEPLWMCFYIFSAVTVFYLAHWQTYVTGSLQFGKFDVTELQFICMSLHIVSCIGGPEIWLYEIPIVATSLRDVNNWIMVIGTIGNVWNKLSIIQQGGPGRNGSAVGNMSIIAPMFPLLFVLWQAYYVYQHIEAVQNHMLLFIFVFGVIISKITDRLVMAHMTQTEMPLLEYVYVLPVVLIAGHYWNVLRWIPDYWLLWTCVIHAVLDISIYCARICMEIRDYLGIRVFSMQPLPSPGYLRKPDAGIQQKRNIPPRINLQKDGRSSPRTTLPRVQH